jgi:cytochrome P450 family 142 subfamily A polypeptide 1
MTTTTPPPTTQPSVNLLDPEFYIDPWEAYRWLRDEAPAFWDPVQQLWGISRYDDVIAIEKDGRRYSSFAGSRPHIDQRDDRSMINLDEPEHQQQRNLVSRRFTPRAAGQWEDHIREVVTSLIDDMVAQGGECEIVDTLAAPLPAMMIGKLLGFGPERWRELKHWSETTIALGGGPRYMNDEGLTSAFEFAAASAALFEEKQGCPADDVMSVWTNASVDGVPLTLDEVIPDCLLILDGGAETTRTVIGRTILNFIDHPEQWERFRDGADSTVATEEFIRYVSPVNNMCRVATEDVEIGGETIRAGQQVVLMYPSANRDPEHFTDPEAFDIGRHPNQHLAFGFGTHFCLGASLARLEIRVFFEELRKRVKDFRLVPGTTPVDLPNAFVFGLTSAQVQFDLV